MNIQGKIIEIFETKQVTEKFRKREFVIEYADNPQFPQYIKFELAQNNCDFLDGFSKGDFVDVQFDIKGRPWTNKEGVTTYFTTLSAWKIQIAEGKNSDAPPPDAEKDDDLPF